MCDCLPENFRSNFRCRKKSRYFSFDIGNVDLFGIALELTVIHIWLYMVILGVLIAFTIKTFGYCCTQKNSQVKSQIRKNNNNNNNGGDVIPAAVIDQPSSLDGDEDRESLVNSSESDLGGGCNCNRCQTGK